MQASRWGLRGRTQSRQVIEQSGRAGRRQRTRGTIERRSACAGVVVRFAFFRISYSGGQTRLESTLRTRCARPLFRSASAVTCGMNPFPLTEREAMKLSQISVHVGGPWGREENCGGDITLALRRSCGKSLGFKVAIKSALPRSAQAQKQLSLGSGESSS